MRLTKGIIERLQQIPITELFERYHIQWEEGRNFKRPWGNTATGRTPSCRYYKNTNSIGDFGTHKGGGPINFVALMENISFTEAAEKLMGWYNIEGPAEFNYQSYLDRLNKDEHKYQDQLKINSFAAALSTENLTETQEFNLWYLYLGLYLLDTTTFIRSVTAALRTPKDEFIRTLDDDIRFLYKENLELLSTFTPHLFTQQRQFNPDNLFCGYMEHSIVPRWNNLDGRYIFPEFLPYHILPGFSGRALDNHIVKYWTYFDFGLTKSDILYGLDVAFPYIRKEGFVILVEGILDVLRCRSLGIMNVVSPCSTYMSETHFHILSAYTDKFLLCFDSDTGGMAATEKSVSILDKYRKEYEVTTLPEGEDPDSIGLKSPDTLILGLSNKWR